jgi:hypothetical protein
LALPGPECAAQIGQKSKSADKSKKPKKPKDPAGPSRAKAARLELPPPDNSRERRADFAAAHRALKSTPPASTRCRKVKEASPELARILGIVRRR